MATRKEVYISATSADLGSYRHIEMNLTFCLPAARVGSLWSSVDSDSQRAAFYEEEIF